MSREKNYLIYLLLFVTFFTFLGTNVKALGEEGEELLPNISIVNQDEIDNLKINANEGGSFTILVETQNILEAESLNVQVFDVEDNDVTGDFLIPEVIVSNNEARIVLSFGEYAIFDGDYKVRVSYGDQEIFVPFKVYQFVDIIIEEAQTEIYNNVGGQMRFGLGLTNISEINDLDVQIYRKKLDDQGQDVLVSEKFEVTKEDGEDSVSVLLTLKEKLDETYEYYVAFTGSYKTVVSDFTLYNEKAMTSIEFEKSVLYFDKGNMDDLNTVLSFVIGPENATDRDVIFTSEDTSVVSCGAANDGTVTINGVGKTTVKVSSKNNPDIFDTVEINVIDTSFSLGEPIVIGNVVSDEVYDYLGGTYRFPIQNLNEYDLEFSIFKGDEEVTSDFMLSMRDDEITISLDDGTSFGDYTLKVVNKAVGPDGFNSQSEVTRDFKVLEFVHAEDVDFSRVLAIKPGETFDLEPIVTPENTTIKDFKFESSNPDVATISDNKVTGVSIGSTVIRVISTYDDERIFYFSLDVVDPSITNFSHEFLGSIGLDDTLFFEGKDNRIRGFLGLEGYNDVSFTIKDSEGNEIDNSGASYNYDDGTFLIELPTDMVAGNYVATLKASYIKDDEIAFSEEQIIDFVVNPLILIDSINVLVNGKSVNEVKMDLGSSFDFDVVLNSADAGETITFPDVDIQVDGNISLDGKKITALDYGDAVLRISSVYQTDKYKEVIIRIVNPTASWGLIKTEGNLALDPGRIYTGSGGIIKANYDLEVYDKVNFRVLDSDKNAYEAGIAISNNSGVATIMLGSNVPAGTYYLEMTPSVQLVDGVKSVTLEKEFIVYDEVKMNGITLNKLNLMLEPGDIFLLEAELSDGSSRTLEWSSSDTDIVTVTEDGTLTAVSRGIAMITVKATDDPDIEATMYVRVVEPSVSLGDLEITSNVDDDINNLYAGRGGVVKSTFTLEDVNKYEFDVVDSYGVIVTDDFKIEEDGSNINLIVKSSIAEGEYTLLLEGTMSDEGENDEDLRYVNTVSASKSFVVSEEVPMDSLTLDKEFQVVLTNQELDLTAIFNDDATFKQIIWSSSDENIATVDEGHIVAVAPGEVTITARAKHYDKEVTFKLLVIDTDAQFSNITLKGYDLRDEGNIYHSFGGIITGDYIFTDVNKIYVEVKQKDSGDLVTEGYELSIDEENKTFALNILSLMEAGNYTYKIVALHDDTLSTDIEIVNSLDGINVIDSVLYESEFEVLTLPVLTDFKFDNSTNMLTLAGSVLNYNILLEPFNGSYESITWEASDDIVMTLSDDQLKATVDVGQTLKNKVVKACIKIDDSNTICKEINLNVVRAKIITSDFTIKGDEPLDEDKIFETVGGEITATIDFGSTTDDNREFKIIKVTDSALLEQIKNNEDVQVTGEDVTSSFNYDYQNNNFKLTVPEDVIAGDYVLVMKSQFFYDEQLVDSDYKYYYFKVYEYVPLIDFETDEEIFIEEGKTIDLDIIFNPINTSFKQLSVEYETDSDKDIFQIDDLSVTALARGTGKLIITSLKDNTIRKEVTVHVVKASTDIKINSIVGTKQEDLTKIFSISGGTISGEFTLSDVTNSDYKIEIYDEADELVNDQVTLNMTSNSYTIEIGANALPAGEYKVVLTGYYKDGENVVSEHSSEVKFVVNQFVAVNNILLNASAGTSQVGNITKLSVSFDPVDVTSKEFVFESSNPNVARVLADGTVTAVSRGTATIKVSAKYQTDKTYTYTIKVVEPKMSVSYAKKNSNLEDVPIIYASEGGVINARISKQDISNYDVRVLKNNSTVVTGVRTTTLSNSSELSNINIILPNNLDAGKYTIEIKGRYQDSYLRTTDIVSTYNFDIEDHASNANLFLNTDYSVNGAYVHNVKVNTSYNSFVSSLNMTGTKNLYVYDLNKREVNNGVLGTGFMVRQVLTNNTNKDYYLVISGDVNGDGVISSRDYIRIRAHIMETNRITDAAQLLGADVNGDGSINSRDYVRVRQTIMNGGN